MTLHLAVALKNSYSKRTLQSKRGMNQQEEGSEISMRLLSLSVRHASFATSLCGVPRPFVRTSNAARGHQTTAGEMEIPSISQSVMLHRFVLLKGGPGGWQEDPIRWVHGSSIQMRKELVDLEDQELVPTGVESGK